MKTATVRTASDLNIQASNDPQPVSRRSYKLPTRIVATDPLYSELEMRYGGGFAQWLVDRMDE